MSARAQSAGALVARLAVEDDALLGQRLGQVLGCLRLASARGPSGCAAQKELQRPGQRQVDAVDAVELADERVALVPVCAAGAGELVAQLRDPRKVGDGGDAGVAHRAGDVSRVHVDRDERTERLALQLGDLARHDARQLEQLLVHLGEVLGNALVPVVAQRLVDLERPEDGGAGDERGARPFEHPLAARRLRVVCASVDDRLPHRALHLVEYVAHPRLDAAVRSQPPGEGHRLALAGDHRRHLEVGLERELVDVLEALFQVGLHGERVFGLRQDLEELVVGQEVEA
eukprot:6202819-Pleurochrysis_carterae.AAC.2